MKILVTGGAGFIGSAVVRQAIAAGYDVVNVDKLTYAANIRNLDTVMDSPAYRFEQADICDGAEIMRIFERHKPDGVINLAAESHVDRSIDGPGDFISTNIVGTYTLLEVAREFRAHLPKKRSKLFRFLHVSTDEVYGALGPSDPAFEETTPYDPSSPYSASKAASDHLVRAWSRTYGLPIIITNCSNNYGPYQFPEKLIPVIIFNALNRKPIPVYGEGQYIRDWLYVDDHAKALCLVLTSGKSGQTYNIGGSSERSNLDIVQMLCRLINKKRDDGFDYESLIQFVEDRPGHDLRYAVNTTKIERELSWQSETSLEKGLELTLDWYLENQTWWDSTMGDSKFGQRLGLKTRGS